MIEGPLTGATESDAASSADVTALAATVATNTTAITTKAAAADLATAEGTLVTHTGQLVGLTTSFNNIGNSFYNKTLTDALLSGKQATVGDGDLTIARTSLLQTALDGKQASLSNNGGGGVPMLNGAALRQVSAVAPLSAAILYDFANPSDANNNNVELSVDLSGKQDTIQCIATNALTTFTTPVTCQFDLQCPDLIANAIYGGAAVQINSAISTATALCVQMRMARRSMRARFHPAPGRGFTIQPIRIGAPVCTSTGLASCTTCNLESLRTL